MHKIDTDTAVGNEFVDGNEAASIKATRLNASWFNTIQRELSYIVQKAGMALSKSDDGQVFTAIFKYIKDNGISGIKKALAFVDENSRRTLNLSVWGVTFTQNRETCSISMDENELHFEGNSVFNNSVKFLSDALFEAGVSFQEGGPSIFVNDKGIISVLNQDGSYAPFRASALELEGKLKSGTLEVGDLHITTVNARYDGAFSFKGAVTAGSVSSDENVTAKGNVSGASLSALKSLNAGTVVVSRIYDAASKSDLQDPTGLLSGAALAGATALVRNMTGDSYEISRQGYGSNRMYLIVEPGEVLRYVYDGSKWVHSW